MFRIKIKNSIEKCNFPIRKLHFSIEILIVYTKKCVFLVCFTVLNSSLSFPLTVALKGSYLDLEKYLGLAPPAAVAGSPRACFAWLWLAFDCWLCLL